MSSPEKHLYEFGPFRLDAKERLLLRDGEAVPLEPKVFDTLILLIRNSGHLLEKDELINKVWPDAVIEEGSLTRNISTLRRVLGDGENGLRYIETVPTRGYRFVATVRDLEDESPDSVERAANGKATATSGGAQTPIESSAEPTVHTAEVIAGRPPLAEYPVANIKRYKGAAVVMAVAIVFAIAIVSYIRSSRSSQPPIVSVAILPFAHEGNDPNMEYFSDGISESLINNLSQLPQLKVIARSSAFKYKGKEIDPQEVAQALGVEAIVSGRIVKSASR
jgi:DNA-binding winged helix-turn-helix (wHTH) protein